MVAFLRWRGTLRIFSRRKRMQRERMHRAREFCRQRRIDHAMTVDARLADEGLRHNINSEMRLAAGPVTRMAFVQMRFIDDIETFGRESIAQLFCDVVFCGHDPRNIARYSPTSMTV